VPLVIDDDDHPDADLAVHADKRRAVDPFIAAFFVVFAYPPYLGCYTSAVRERGGEFFSNTVGAANLVHEWRL
jgi:hypothetical protein